MNIISYPIILYLCPVFVSINEHAFIFRMGHGQHPSLKMDIMNVIIHPWTKLGNQNGKVA